MRERKKERESERVRETYAYVRNVYSENHAITTMRTMHLVDPAGGRDASVSACADLTNQLQYCRVDPACAWIKH